jgi:3-oxoacyl-[acyl-carrier protein] reductase
MTKTLQNKVALVTGGSRGIGAAIAQRLAADGAEVVVHYGNSQAAAEKVVAGIVANGGKASLVQADLSRADGPSTLAKGVKHSRVDILVNNAGVAPFANIEDTSEEVFDQLSNVNMRSLFFVTKHMLPKIPDGGRIINISSSVSRIAFPGIPAYAATKGFVDVLTLQLAATLGPRNITVNAVAPGAIDTEMSSWIRQPGGTDTLKQIQALPGVGTADKIAGAVAFLAGPDGAWSTGIILEASGGTKL